MNKTIEISESMPDNGYAFIILTDSYSNNFEKDMCAFITGTIGECGVGEECQKEFNKWLETSTYKQNPFENNIFQVSDEHGCRRPVAIASNPSYFNIGMGQHFKTDDPNSDSKALEAYRKYMESYEMSQIESLKLIKLTENPKKGDWTQEAVDRNIKRHLKNIDTAKALTKPYHYPAFLSVALFFHNKPSQELIDLMKQRAQEYVNSPLAKCYPNNKPIKIEGFVLQHKIAKFEEETV